MEHQTESHPDKKGTDISKYIDLKRIKRVLKLDKRIFKEIRDDKHAFIPALTVLYVSSLVPLLFSFLYTLEAYFFRYNFFANFGGYFGSVFGFQSMGMLFFEMIVSLVLTVFFLPVGWFIGTGILHLIAKALGGKSSFKGYMYATAYTRVPAVLAFIPFLGGLIGGLWSLACLVVATRETQEFSTGKAVLTIAIPMMVSMVLAIIAALIMVYAFHIDPLVWMGLKHAAATPYQYNYDELMRQYQQYYRG
jgi:hypothetical protein